ncbi:MAG TPA: hypothetical protein VK993_02145 [Chthoniobacterales bacterium]|nr:hypothetical protein [Chthoniobacterales bacterium]
MKPRFWNLLTLSSIACTLLATSALAEPIDFSEVSLLVRAREAEASIRQEVTRRKLVRPLTPQQENTLRAQGATDSLIQALRASTVHLSQADAAAFDARRDQARNPSRDDAPRSASFRNASSGRDDVHIFDVSPGHPINLSQWGGPDYEFAFRAPTRFDEGREDAVMIDNVGSYTHVATYLGAGRPDDSTTIFDRRNYVSIMDHSFTRGLRIDRQHPVWMKGVPYALYPVYAAGGVSLYYIGGSSHSVKLAVMTARPL